MTIIIISRDKGTILSSIKTFMISNSLVYVQFKQKKFYFMMAFRLKVWEVNCVPYHCTRMYPMALMCLFPLSGERVASFPHVLESSCRPPVPKPIRELQEEQSFCWLAVMPILALEKLGLSPTALNPSLLQLGCKEACEPISHFHVSRPSEVLRYFPSAIREWRESARLLMTMNLSWLPIFIPRHILAKDVVQKVGNIVSCKSKPVLPPRRL